MSNDPTLTAARLRELCDYDRQTNHKWRARIMLNGKSHSLGYYATEAEAMAAYRQAKLNMHEFYRTGLAATT